VSPTSVGAKDTSRSKVSHIIPSSLTVSAPSPLQLASVAGAMARKGVSSLQRSWQDRFIAVDDMGNPIEYFAPALLDPELLSAERVSQVSYMTNVLKVLVDKCEIANSMLRGWAWWKTES
jgi:hypothetical protein